MNGLAKLTAASFRPMNAANGRSQSPPVESTRWGTPSEASSRASVRPLGVRRLCEPLAQAAACGVDVEPAARLGIDEPDMADVGSSCSRGSRISTATTAWREASRSRGVRQSRGPRKSETTTVSERCRATRASCVSAVPIDVRADPLGLGIAADGQQDSEQPDASLARTQHERRRSAEGGDADPVSAPRREVADGDRDALGDVPLAPVGGPEPHRRRDVEEHPGRQRALGDVDPHLHLAGTRRGVPVDTPDVVARLPLADLRELRADADRGSAMLAGEQPVDPPADLQIERAQERLGERARAWDCPGSSARGGGGGAHAARSTRSISGMGTASRTESTIESAPTSAASAS